MTSRSLTATLTLYRSGTLTLDQAAARSGVPVPELRAQLRSHGIAVREEGESTADPSERARA